jgi:hypothetical protein
MTSTNMGICFGVSLISNTNNNNSISSQQGNASLSPENHSNSQIIQKSIDMSTATNVFDFLLTNHSELFPGDVNFNMSNSNSLKSTGNVYNFSNNSAHLMTNTMNNNNNNNNNTNMKSVSSKVIIDSSLNNSHNTVQNNLDQNTPSSLASRHYLLNDSSLNEHTPSIVSSMSQQFGMQQLPSQQVPSQPSFKSSASSLTHSPSNASQYGNVNRHVKQNSIDNHRNTLIYSETLNTSKNEPISVTTSMTSPSNYVNNYVKTNQLVYQQSSQPVVQNSNSSFNQTE